MSKIKKGSKICNMSDTSGKKRLKYCTQVQWALLEDFHFMLLYTSSVVE